MCHWKHNAVYFLQSAQKYNLTKNRHWLTHTHHRHRSSQWLDPFLHIHIAYTNIKTHAHRYTTFYIHNTEHSYLFKQKLQEQQHWRKWSSTDLIYIILYSFIHNTLAWLQSQRKSTHFEAIISVIQISFLVHPMFHNGLFSLTTLMRW